MAPTPQPASHQAAYAHGDAGHRTVTIGASPLQPKITQSILPFVTSKDLNPQEALPHISEPTNFRHLKTGGERPLLTSTGSPGPTVPHFSRPAPQRRASSPELSPVRRRSPRLSYFIHKTLHHAPEPVPSNLANKVTKAMTTNNRLEIILDGLDELDYIVQKKLDDLLEGTSIASNSSSGSSLASKPSSNSSAETTATPKPARTSSLKGILSIRKRPTQPQPQSRSPTPPQPPPSKPSPDPYLISTLRTHARQINHQFTQVQSAKRILKRQMIEASAQTTALARHVAEGDHPHVIDIVAGAGVDESRAKERNAAWGREIEWILRGAEEFVREFDVGSALEEGTAGRRKSVTMSVLSTWSDR